MDLVALWRADREPIADPGDEISLIHSARSGDDAALLRLFAAYVGLLRHQARRYVRLDVDFADLAQAGLIALSTATRAHREGRLATLVSLHARREFVALSWENRCGVTIPESTLSRFTRIMRAAEGDSNAARDLAPSMEMTTSTFDAVKAALAPHLDPDDLQDLAAPEPDDDLTDDALAAVDALPADERTIIRAYFGLDGGPGYSDRALAERLGGPWNRRSVEKKRVSALATLRTALAA